MREHLLKLKGIPLTSPQANAIRFSDRDAQYEIDAGLSVEEAALAYHRGYHDGPVWQGAAAIVRGALNNF